ncbi:DUF192 domain-containing protein [Erythrobacter sp.]|uniref:DUF192 domain-containing protein n=1 Tax=Erythrobacter sp. TaxID=1042 RepID=UPI003C758D4A
MKVWLGIMGLAQSIALASCSATEPSASAEGEGGAQSVATDTEAGPSAVHPQSGLPIIDVTVDTGENRIGFATELGETAEAQARGLMFRTELGDFEAMLFPSQSAEARSFWMKNTPLELDIIFIDPEGRIANIERGEPYSTQSVLSEGPASAVLEIRGGRASELGIEPGDKVEYDLP